MSEKLKMLAGEFYRASDALLTAERANARRLCHAYNESVATAHAVEGEGKRESILSELLGTKPKRLHIEPRFRCDYGYNIHLGDHFYANYDLIILDVCEVNIGRNCMIGPRVSICTATHPVDSEQRVSGDEYGAPIAIGDNVWIGAHAVINPGVTLGNDVVVASGAVVTQSFQDNVVIAGVPAKVVRVL